VQYVPTHFLSDDGPRMGRFHRDLHPGSSL